MTHKHQYWLDPEVAEKWWMAFWCDGCRTYANVHRHNYQALLAGKLVVVSEPSPYWNTEIEMKERRQ